MKYIGLISGTSMDGIDAALVDLTSNCLVKGIIYKYSDLAKRNLDKLKHDKNFATYQSYVELNNLIGHEFANAALKLMDFAKINSSDLKAIGSHGQTVFHNACKNPPYTLQLGCAHTIAERTQITVVSDFRSRDLILGGKGAPLAPVFHQELFKAFPKPLIIINIGGIANVTILLENKLLGFDLGPGNCLMDVWISKNLRKNFDRNGNWAAKGKIINSLLSAFLADPYFYEAPPKSTSTEYFSFEWLKLFLDNKYDTKDVQATLLMLTVQSIVNGIRALKIESKEILVCGGGVHNHVLMKKLNEKFSPNTKVLSTDSYSISPDYVEAMLFAWLAKKALAKEPLDLNSVTGARSKAVLGVIYPYASF